MTKALIIAEKPSVANDIAKALGGFTKHDEYFESDEYVLSSAVGHLLEIAVPEEYDVKRGKWSFTHLPMIPPYFALNPIAKTESRLKVLNKLIKRKDVTTLINACDAGREGELIFRLIAQNAKAKQSVKRLWLQSMTPNAIRDGFAHLRSDEEMLPLADAARCRSEADWLIGINGTRAMTAFNSKEGGFFLTTVGRVQTPTLSIVAKKRSASSWRATTGKCAPSSSAPPASTKGAGWTRNSRRTRTIRKSVRNACGARPPPNPSSLPATASRVSSPRNRNRPPRWRRPCST
jgi:DNA topoisomerase-3